MRDVSTSHRLLSATEGSTASKNTAPSPPARRVSVGRWRDPRLWLGLALVCGSVVIGAKLLATADDTVAVWQLDRAASAGMPISADDLRIARVHFDDEAVADLYWPATRGIPTSARVLHDVSEGELLSSAAIAIGDASSLRQMPLSVSSSGFPAGLSVGDQVDVWAVPEVGGAASPRLVLGDVMVMDLGVNSSVGIAGDRDVAVSMPADADVADALGSLNGASVVLIMLGA